MGNGAHQDDSQFATTIYINAQVFTVNDDQPWAQAIAIHNKSIMFVGTNDEVLRCKGDETKIVDLDNGFVMPGIHDMHCHPDWALAGEFSYYNHWHSFPGSLEEMRDNILELDKLLPKDEWIYAGPINPFAFNQENVNMDASWLDAIVPDRKVALIDGGHHTLLTNSKTVALAGLHKESIDPSNGVIVRDDSGHPNGLFKEGAQTIIKGIMPEIPVSDFMKMFSKGAHLLHSQGITSAKFHHLNLPRLQALRELDRNNSLNLKVEASISWKDDVVVVDRRWDLLAGERFEYQTDHVNPNAVKFYLDGIPPNRTTFESKPFQMGPELPKIRGNKFIDDSQSIMHDTCCLTSGYGCVNFTYPELKSMVLDMDRRGIRVVAHAIGDLSANWYVSAVENARKVNGPNGPRHQLAHSNSISRDDIRRARDCDMIIEFSPQMWWPSQITAALWKLYDKEKADRYWPFREAQDEQANYCFGSDWPVHGLQWWNAIEAMITRTNPDKSSGFDEPMGLNMGLTVKEAVYALTMGGAYAMGTEDTCGSLEAGKDADFVVLDKNLFEIPSDTISTVKVMRTIFEGDEVYLA